MSNKVVTLQNYKKGAKVVRGPAWKWGSQDCDKNGKQTIGILGETDICGDGTWAFVNWKNKRGENVYRLFEEDLVYFEESPQLELGL